jgi:hypothetical protein
MEKLIKIIAQYPDVFDAEGKKDSALVSKAEKLLGVRLPETFKQYLQEVGTISFEGKEYLGIIHGDFANSGIPDVVWYNLRQREKYGFPPHLIVFYNDDSVQFTCLDTSSFFSADECKIVVWDNVFKKISDSVEISFGDFLLEEMEEALEELELED